MSAFSVTVPFEDVSWAPPVEFWSTSTCDTPVWVSRASDVDAATPPMAFASLIEDSA